MTDSDLARLLQQLEVELQQPATRRNPARLEALLHPDFIEFGRSGRRYSRRQMLAALAEAKSFAEIVSRSFELHRLDRNTALLTYRSSRKDNSGNLHRHTLRASVWQQNLSRWQLIFHQGTPCDDQDSVGDG